MPFVDYNLRVVRELLREMVHDKDRRGKIATFSHPDLIAAPGEILTVSPESLRDLPIRKDSAAIIAWHKAGAILKEVYDTPAYFRALGYEMTAFDVNEGRGGEVLHDLGRPWPDHLRHHQEQYDLVFDCIANQVFNVAQCFANAASLPRLGGYVVHHLPAHVVNQGFYDIGPGLFKDFYAVNGYEIVLQALVVGIYRKKADLQVAYRRMREVPDDTMNLVVAKRREIVRHPVWPIMGKFVQHPTCHGPVPRESPP